MFSTSKDIIVCKYDKDVNKYLEYSKLKYAKVKNNYVVTEKLVFGSNGKLVNAVLKEKC